jgi:hypothetical protein
LNYFLKELDHYYLQQPEPQRGCLLALRDIILSLDDSISPAWKWQLPFFCYRGRMFCYLNFHKKFKLPYLALVDGHRLDYPELLAENRSRMKILLVDPEKDLPLALLHEILRAAIALHTSEIMPAKK